MNFARFSESRFQRTTSALAASLAVSFVLAGCGAGTLAPQPDLQASPMSGRLKGGPNPIIGSTVRAYTTGTAYGTGVLRETQTTDMTGSFAFSGTYPCPSGQFLYLTAVGGNTGGGASNPAAVLVGAVGRCDDVFAGGKYNGQYVTIDELSTIAAAYALSGFATATTTGNDTVVGIGAPANNNAAVGSTTAAAGLRHAFQNAANLVDVQGQSTTSARAATVGATQATAPIVPRELINSIGNALVACVNSGFNVNSATACNTIFAAATVGANPAPTNVFQAMLNVAQHPALSYTANGTAVTGRQATYNFLTAASPTTNVYSPNIGATLTATNSPVDLSLAIIYPNGTGAGTGYPLTGGATPTTGPATGIVYADDIALDVNDNVYVLNSSGDTATTNAQQNVLSLTSNGNFISATADNALVKTGQRLATDTAGNIWSTNSNGGGTGVERYGYSAGVLTAGTAVPVAFGSYGLAVDRANNVWVGVNANGTTLAGLDEITTTGGVSTVTLAGTVGGSAANLFDVLIDPKQNVFVSGDLSGTTVGGFVYALQNTGTTAAPVYTSTNSSVSGASPTQKSPYGLYYINSATPSLFGSNNVNGTNVGGLYPYTLTYSGTTNAVTAISAPGTLITGNGYQATTYGKVDGLFNVFSAQSTTNKIIEQPFGSTTSIDIFGCASSSGTCVNPLSAAQDVAIDASGAIWVANRGTGKGNSSGTTPSNGSLVQILGVGSPTWPQVSLGLTGEPQ